LFHDRQQKPKEREDEYVEALRLFVKAYSNLSRGGQKAESMGQPVLANQFVNGLKPGLKAKVVSNEGNMEQLLMKARFEEAKQKELARVVSSDNHGNQKDWGPKGYNSTTTITKFIYIIIIRELG